MEKTVEALPRQATLPKITVRSSEMLIPMWKIYEIKKSSYYAEMFAQLLLEHEPS